VTKKRLHFLLTKSLEKYCSVLPFKWAMMGFFSLPQHPDCLWGPSKHLSNG